MTKDLMIKKLADPSWCPAFGHAKGEAIDGGWLYELGLVPFGKFTGHTLLATRDFLDEFGGESMILALLRGLSETLRMDTTQFLVNKRRIWVDDNGSALTFMLPKE